MLFDADTGRTIFNKTNNPVEKRISYDETLTEAIATAHKEGRRIIALHNHPEGYPPTADDSVSALVRGYEKGVVCGHNGEVYTYLPSPVKYSQEECYNIHNLINLQLIGPEKDVCKTWKDMLLLFQIEIEKR